MYETFKGKKKKTRFPKVQSVLDGDVAMFEFQDFIGMSETKDMHGDGGQDW